MSNSSKPLIITGIIFLMAISFELLYSSSSLSYLTDSKYDGDYNASAVSSSASNSSGIKKSSIVLIVGGVAVVVLVAAILTRKNSSSSSNELKLDKTKELDDNKFKAFVPSKTKEEFLKDRVNDLLELQNSRMNFDYNTLRNKVSEELFNEYNNELNNLQSNNEQNIMKDFKAIDNMVTSADVVNSQYEIRVEVIMQYIDYIVKDGVCIKGDEYLPIIKHYELVFTSSLRNIVDTCPTCGASLIDKTSKICPNCNNPIVKESKWVLSKKICKGQK